MKVGDLVKWREMVCRQFADPPHRSIGVVIEFKHTFCSGGGGEWPSSETRAIVSWSSEKGAKITSEREDDLEVVSENR